MRNRFEGLIVLIAILVGGSAQAQPTPSFVVPMDLPAAGLRIRLPTQSVEEPLPPIDRHAFVMSKDGREWMEERFDPRGIWLRAQLLGQWRDSHGTRMRILQIRTRLPEDVRNRYVQRHEYEAWLATMPDLSLETSAVLLDWVADYLENEPGPPEGIRMISAPLEAGALVPTGDPRRLLYILRIQLPQVGTLQRVGRNFVVDLVLGEGANPQRAQRSFEERFLRALDVLPHEMTLSASGSQPSAGPPHNPAEAAVAASRAEAHASVANLRNWWSLDMRDYVVLSNQRRGASQLIRDLENDLESMRAAYAALVPALQPIRAVGVIRIFAEQEEYTRYVGEAYAWSGGLWIEGRGELVIRPVEQGRYDRIREGVMQTVYHEAFHQYLSLATQPLRVCVWFNEGHAVFFENAVLQRGVLSFRESEAYVPLAAGLPLDVLFAMKYADFYSGTDDQRRQRYATAWALVYYLRRAAAAEAGFAFAGLLDDYMLALKQERDGPRAIQSLLARYDLKALQADFADFWSSPRRRREALRAPMLADGPAR